MAEVTPELVAKVKAAMASSVEEMLDRNELAKKAQAAIDLHAAIEAHVAACPRCEAFIASYREMPRIVREATRTEMPADLEASLLAALRAARGSGRGRDE